MATGEEQEPVPAWTLALGKVCLTALLVFKPSWLRVTVDEVSDAPRVINAFEYDLRPSRVVGMLHANDDITNTPGLFEPVIA
jgi:hypothetical protein